MEGVAADGLPRHRAESEEEVTSSLARAPQDVHQVQLRVRSDSPARPSESEDHRISQVETRDAQRASGTRSD